MLAAYAALAALLASASAFPAYIPATQIPGAVRSPCPGLNSLANHGFLPRSGKNISIPVLVKGCLEGLNVGPDFCTVIGAVGLQSFGAMAKGEKVFNLDDLNEHNLIEHDASLSRQDLYFGDNHSFNETIYTTLKNSPRNGLHTPLTAGPVRALRLAASTATDRRLTYLPQQAILAFGEAALFLSVMGDPVTGIAKSAYVNSFFEQERLPYELGWTPPVAQTNFPSLALLIPRILAAANDPELELSDFSISALKLAFGGQGLPGTTG